ncbi:MAG: nuclear transport factor 2 family protein [Vicinamibacterales bacterium]
MAQTLLQAHDALYAALNAMLEGDSAPLHEVWSSGADITFAGPFGGFQAGRELVVADFDRVASMRLGGSITVTGVHAVEGVDMGITTCTEHGEGHVIDGKPVSLTHRVTNVFRKESAGWKLIHHHTDPSGVTSPA